MKTLQSVYGGFPPMDKFLALTGAAATGLSLSDISTGVGIIVGLTTIGMLIPRAILNWSDLLKSRDSGKSKKK